VQARKKKEKKEEEASVHVLQTQGPGVHAASRGVRSVSVTAAASMLLVPPAFLPLGPGHARSRRSRDIRSITR
jgi:hypothetical protein